MTNMRNSLEPKGKFWQAEERINKFKDRSMKIKSEDQREKKVEEKWTEPRGPVVHHQVNQHMHC